MSFNDCPRLKLRYSIIYASYIYESYLMDKDYSKLMDDLESQDRLLLLVTDKLVNTIEELKIAHATNDLMKSHNEASQALCCPSRTSEPSLSEPTKKRSDDSDSSLTSRVVQQCSDDVHPEVRGNRTHDLDELIDKRSLGDGGLGRNEQEWTVTLTDGIGRSSEARSVKLTPDKCH